MIRKIAAKWARRVVQEVIKPEVIQLKNDVMEALTNSRLAIQEVKSLRKQLTSMQAIDVGFKESGKLILLARVGGQDVVKILDIHPNMSVQEYRKLCEKFKSEYGAQPVYVDAPRGTPDFTSHG